MVGFIDTNKIRNTLWVQQRLVQLGFNPGPLDGVRGPRTDAAIVAFKKSIGFRARPYVGPLTLAALEEAPGNPDSQLPWVTEAQYVRGLHEIRDHGKLKSWFDKSVSWIDPRDIPWCGAFVATALRKYDPNIVLPKNPLGAQNWKSFGKESPPVFGSILVFWRGSRNSWKGHVGFYVGEDESYFHVLGGNQSNAVTITRVAKHRLIGARWPAGTGITGKRIWLDSNGVPITHNEA